MTAVMDGDVEVFKEEEDDADEHKSSSSGNVTEEEEEESIIANGIVYSRIPPATRRLARNVMDNTCQRNLAHATSEIEALFLFLPEELLRLVLRHTNRKCHDLSRQHNQ